MVKKYGVKYVMTDEWVALVDKTKSYLFTADEDKVKQALVDILVTDGGYDGETKDFKIETIELPEEFDGSSLLVDEDVYFVKPNLVQAELAKTKEE